MLSPEVAARPSAAGQATAGGSDPLLPLALLELELSLEGYDGGEAGFCEAVRQAASSSGGEFLFDLPAAGLIEDCSHVAVLQVPTPDRDMRVALAVLDRNGTEIRMQTPDHETAHLVRFAEAFIDVLKRI